MSSAVIASNNAYFHQKPEEKSEIVTQGIYSEEIKILESSIKSDWVKVQTIFDGYTGWIHKRHIAQPHSDFSPNAAVTALKALLYREPTIIYGFSRELPFEARIDVLEAEDKFSKIRLLDGSTHYIATSDFRYIETSIQFMTAEKVFELALRFLELPYVWGGRSSLTGYDCSGFIQMLLRQMGYKNVPRDSKDQYTWGELIPASFSSSRPCDIIFFGESQDKITHVALYLGNSKFIHATTQERPHIHISDLQDTPWNEKSQNLPFRAIKRLKCFS